MVVKEQLSKQVRKERKKRIASMPGTQPALQVLSLSDKGILKWTQKNT